MENLTVRTLTNRFKKLGKEGFTLTVDLKAMTAKLDRLTSRSKYGYKNCFYIRFRTEQNLMDYINKDYNDRINMEKAKVTFKAETKTRNQKAQDNVKVGDIFRCSWGYEQTNINFYKVVSKKGAATVELQEIGYNTVEETSWCSADVVADPTRHKGEVFTKRLNGDTFKMSSFQYCSKMEDPKAKCYNSWGY